MMMRRDEVRFFLRRDVEVRGSWMGMWGLGEYPSSTNGGNETEDGTSKAKRLATSLVLKRR